MSGIVQSLGVGYSLGSFGVSQEDSGADAPPSDYEAFNVTDNGGESFNGTDGEFSVLK